MVTVTSRFTSVLSQKGGKKHNLPVLLSLDDTEALLNTLMLLSTFMLAFSAGTLLEYNYDDVTAADLRMVHKDPKAVSGRE